MTGSAPAPARGRRRAGQTSHRRALLAYLVVVGGTTALAGLDRTLGAMVPVLTVLLFPFLLRNLAYVVSAARWADRDLHAPTVGTESFTPSVAVLVACKNDQVVVDDLVATLLALDYPAEAMTVVIVDDASTDGTGARLDGWAHTDRRVRVLHRAADSGGGQPGALNDALTMVDADVAVVVDVNHRPERALLRRLVRHFRDPNVGAVTGRCVPRSDAGQALDQEFGHVVDGYGRQALFELPGYGGANYAVRVDLLRSLGGWNRHAITEDTDLTLRVQLAGWRVRHDPSAVDVDEALSSADARRQRYHSARGQQQALREHGSALIRSRHLSVAQKVETMLFLATEHVPVLCGLGLVLICLRAFGIGDASSAAVLAMAVLLMAGPFIGLAVGPLLSRPHRGAVRLLVGFLPAFGTSILTASRAYLEGMLGRSHHRPKRTRAVATDPTVSPTAPAPNADSLSFARREALALSRLNEGIGAGPLSATPHPDQLLPSADVPQPDAAPRPSGVGPR